MIRRGEVLCGTATAGMRDSGGVSSLNVGDQSHLEQGHGDMFCCQAFEN